METCGAAAYDLRTKKLTHFTGELRSLWKWIGDNYKTDEIIVVLENPGLSKNTYGAVGIVTAAATKYKQGRCGIEEVAKAAGIAARMSRNVGENGASAKYAKKLLTAAKVPVIEVSPTERDKAFKTERDGTKRKLLARALTMPTKTDRAQYESVTGFVGVTNEHARDAGTLVAGRSMMWAKVCLEVNGGRLQPQRAKAAKRKPSQKPRKPRSRNYRPF
jgi:hypothetical protein